ncbi:hypothetical protein PITCH_A830005 [uncultured Desulfobacterium sp.]|uniref:Uncharacterized protein n=1 Tax=uncultured Desulfobacterium sp. TaxID=201089 RepID=A0A445N317_9BACT|nr:hypothetical protein PITCH_A830005 [uncultured Desulfobacterium sp.]
MKCPKCSFISFDFNQSCPKCKKDLSELRAKLNTPSFRPAIFDVAGSAAMSDESTLETGPKGNRLDMEEKMEIKISDGAASKSRQKAAPAQPISIDEEEIDFSLEDESDDLTFDFDEPSASNTIPTPAPKKEISITEDSIEAGLDLAFKDDGDELSIDIEGLSLEEPNTKPPEVKVDFSLPKSVEEKLDLSFDDEEDASGEIDPILKDANAKETPIESAVSSDSIEKELELSFDDEEEMDLDSDDFVIDSPDDEISNTNNKAEAVAFDLDIKDSNQQKPIILDEIIDKSPSAGIESAAITELDQNIAIKFSDDEEQIVFDLEESASNQKGEKNQYTSPPSIKMGNDHDFSSELELVDLDLDLDKLDN